MLNDREKQICARLRAFRETLQIPRSRFAVTIGYGSDRMASYESGRAPLPYNVFKAIAGNYDLSALWLAGDSDGPRRKYLIGDADFIDRISPRALFSEVYDTHLAGRLKESAQIYDRNFEAHLAKYEKVIEELRDESLPLEFRQRMAQMLLEPNRKALINMAIESDFRKAVASSAKAILKKDLTNSAMLPNLSDVKEQWPALKRKLQAATTEPGSKSKLAKFLKVDLTRVSQWLTDAKTAREPGAEYALQMLYWVEHPELQK